jgi:hypothetical protein
MNHRKRRIFWAVLSIAVLFLPIPWIAFRYSTQLTFTPSSFFDEYLKFIGSLITVFLAFYLVEVFWASERGIKKAEQIRKIFILKLESVSDIVTKTSQELTVPKATSEEALKRDDKVLTHLKNLDLVRQDVTKMLDEHGSSISEDNNLEVELFKYLEEVDPVIRDLAMIDSIRLHYLEIIKGLSLIEVKVAEMNNRLKGSKK